jgi:hypothetical protein
MGACSGLAEVAKPPNLAKRGGCWFERGAVRVHLGVEEAFRPVRKGASGHRHRRSAGARGRSGSGGHPVTPDRAIASAARVFVDDPFGNRVELIQARGG